MKSQLIEKFFDGKNVTILACVVLGIGAYYYLESGAKEIIMTIVATIGALTRKGEQNEEERFDINWFAFATCTDRLRTGNIYSKKIDVKKNNNLIVIPNFHSLSTNYTQLVIKLTQQSYLLLVKK